MELALITTEVITIDPVSNPYEQDTEVTIQIDVSGLDDLMGQIRRSATSAQLTYWRDALTRELATRKHKETPHA